MNAALDIPVDILEIADAARPSAVTAISFVDFCEHLGVHLDEEHGTLGQRIACLVAYDGVDPIDLPPNEREVARTIFGDLDRISAGARSVIVAICGARAGKSYVLVALRLLHLGLTVDVSPLAPGEVGSVPVIAPTKEHGQQVLDYIKGAIDLDPDLRALRVGDPVAESVTIYRDGHEIDFVVRAASAKGKGGRGKSLLAAALDEAGFFYDASYKVNDEEQFKAVRPRVMPGGQTIIDTTPWAQSGLAYELFVANHPDPRVAGCEVKPQMQGTALAMHAPTLALRDVAYTRELVESELRRDPENGEREYRARFMSSTSQTFFDASAISRMIDDTLPLEPWRPKPGETVTSGGDLGFSKNSSALAVAHRAGDRVVLAELLEIKPKPGEPLKPSVVVAAFAARITWHGGSYFMADGHYRETAVEVLDESAVTFVNAPAAPADAYVRVRTLMNEGRLRIPNLPRLVKQLRETMKRVQPGGGVAIVKPKWSTGEHGDLADAYVLAVYQAAGEEIEKPPPVVGTAEWEHEQRERRRKAKAAEQEKPWWRKGRGRGA